MSANLIWIAGYFGPVAGASPVWIAPGDGTVPSAVQSEIVSYYAPVVGATAVWIAGFFAPPPAAIGATPITISGWGGSGGGGPPPVTSVWSASDATANGMTLSNGGLTVTASSSLAKALNTSIRGTVSKTSGKVYVEFLYIQAGAGNDLVGLADAGFSSSGALGSSIYSEGTGYLTTAVSSGFTTNYSTALYPVNTDVFAVAVDFAAGKIWLAKNNVWLNSSDPAAGSLPIVSFVPATVGALFPAWTGKSASNAVTLQSTAASQTYAPPSGFTPWG